MCENSTFDELTEEDVEILEDVKNLDIVRAERNKEFTKLSEKEQVEFLIDMYSENEKIIKSLNLKTINEDGEINE